MTYVLFLEVNYLHIRFKLAQADNLYMKKDAADLNFSIAISTFLGIALYVANQRVTGDVL